jgi:hypothetical protein
MQELMIMTILLHRHYEFRLEPGFVVEPDPLITQRPKHGMKVVIRPRRGKSLLRPVHVERVREL